MAQLDNKVAIITGGSGALGRAVTEHFLGAGACLAVPYLVEAEVPLLQQRLGARFDQAKLLLGKVDVRDEAAMADFAAQVTGRWGRIDILVNLVGGFWGGVPIAETTLAQWQSMFDLNVTPAFVCCKAVVPLMQKNRWGRIVCVTSRSGLQGAGDFDSYAVAKGAVAGLVSSLAQEVLPDGILVNAIAPSTIDTEANRAAMPKAHHERWVKPEDIARTVAYLCSDDCRVTSGAVIPVYGLA